MNITIYNDHFLSASAWWQCRQWLQTTQVPILFASIDLNREILILMSSQNWTEHHLNFIAGPSLSPRLVRWVSVRRRRVLPSIFSLMKASLWGFKSSKVEMNSTTCSTLQARIFLPSSEQDWVRAHTDWQEGVGADEGGGDTAGSSPDEESLFCLLAGDSVRSRGGWGGLRLGWPGSWPLIMLSRAWAWVGSIRPGGRRPGGNPGAPGAPGAWPRNPGRNWNGEAAAGATESLTASCSEAGGKRKGGKGSGRPGGNERRFLLDWFNLGSDWTSALLDLRKFM